MTSQPGVFRVHCIAPMRVLQVSPAGFLIVSVIVYSLFKLVWWRNNRVRCARSDFSFGSLA
jgi:hypothetical protein